MRFVKKERYNSALFCVYNKTIIYILYPLRG